MKTINQLLKELETIHNYIQNWTDLTDVSNIEKDIVKHHISGLYNSIHELNAVPKIVSTSLFDAPAPLNEPEPTQQPEAIAQPKPTQQPEAVAQPKPTQQPEAVAQPKPTQQPEAIAQPKPTQQPEAIAQPKPTQQPEAVAQPKPTQQPEYARAPELDLSSIMFENQDDISHKKMLNDLLITSLYGDDEKVNGCSLNIDSIIDNAPELEPRLSDVSFVEGEFKINMHPTTEDDIREVSTKRVWGEVMGNSTGMLNESFGTPRKDMATKIASANGNDLHAAIGINDRYMLVRELFNGDIDSYNTTLDTLNQFTDFDDCMIHIQENYRWKPNCEGVKLLIDLISRKLN